MGCVLNVPFSIIRDNFDMPEYRRSFIEGRPYFFTVVTYNRWPILINTEARKLLRSAWIDVCGRFPFATDAMCLLPDHIHCIWALPNRDMNYSVRWKEIKRLFTKNYLEQIGPGDVRSESRVRRGGAVIWQRWFLEHTIRDQTDMNRHLDYIHYNPVKHGLVQTISDWPWSSFYRYVKMGHYETNWGEAVGQEVKGIVCWLLLGETLTLQQLSGCVLMLMGMLMAQPSVFSLSHGQPSQGKPLLPHPPAASPQTEREREQPLV